MGTGFTWSALLGRGRWSCLVTVMCRDVGEQYWVWHRMRRCTRHVKQGSSENDGRSDVYDQSLRSFLTAVTTTDVAPIAVILPDFT